MKNNGTNTEQEIVLHCDPFTLEIVTQVPREEALLKAGALQSAIFNSANFSSIATDAKGVIQIFNVGAERMLGYTADEVVNKITPADISDPQEVIARAQALSVELGTPITPGFEALVFKASRGIEDIYELTYIRKDGSRFPAVVSVTALRDAQDAIIGYLLIGTDNTARKHAEEALHENYALLRTIHLHSIVSVTDQAGRIVDANEGFCKISGYSRDELLGETHRIVNSGVQPRAFWTEMWQTITAGKSWRGEICNRTKEGALYWVDSIIAPFMSEDGHTKGYISVRTDITARKQAEDRLLKAGALQNAIFNSANFSSIATDAKGVIQIFNVGAEQMLGYTADEVVNKITPADISDPQEVIVRAGALSIELDTPIAPGFEALVFKASRGIEDIYELTYFRKDGSRFPAVVSVTALRDEHDTIIGYLLIGTDNTARKQAEEALLKAGALQSAIFNSANFSSIATDAKGVIQIFNVGAERMLGYTAAEVMNKITPADISDPQEVIVRAKALSVELETPITPGFEALVFKASRGIEDIYELTYIRKDGSRFPAVVSVTALRDAQGGIIGYLLIGTDNTARKQAEEALLKAGALQSAIFNSANFSSIATDAKGVIQIFNVGAERMLGYTATEVMNKITPADISDPQEVIVRAKALSVELGTPITPGFEALVFKASRGIEDIYELTYFRKDGTRFPAVVSVTALRDAQGGIIGYLLIGTDNTARKRAEEELLKAGALQNAIFNSANFSSIATDAKGVIQIFNVGAERMLGYAAADVMNKITPADISDPQEVIARAKALSVELETSIAPGFEALVFKASRGIEDIYELTYIRKDGSRFPAVVSVTALRDAQGGIIGYLLIGTDNTARKQIEAEQLQLGQRLRDHQFYTRSLFEANIDALMTTDPSGIITDINKPMEALTGCTRDELIGAPFKNYFTDPDRAEAGIKLVLSKKKVTNYELTARDRDAKETVVSYNATTFYDRDRRLQGVFAAARDITDRKRVDEKLKLYSDKLERSNRELQDFAQVASHDLQEPLRKILSFGDRLKTKAGESLDGDSQDYLQRMCNAAARMQTLINDLMAFSRVEIKGQAFILTDLGVIAREVSADLETRIEQAGGRVEIEELPIIDADPMQMRQLLQNLIGNSLKYFRGGVPPVVRISSRKAAARSIESLDESGPARQFCEILVTDNGIGFDEKYLDRIFTVFQRLHKKGEYEGTGVGLAICRKIVDRHSGTITAHSTPGQGATFVVTLPVTQPKEVEVL
jgi:PAS domain S-box-containing protein